MNSRESFGNQRFERLLIIQSRQLTRIPDRLGSMIVNPIDMRSLHALAL
jgi:hypothetical protein